jgi:hypothetical protein
MEPNQNKGRQKGWDNLRPAKKGEVRNPNGRPPLEKTFSDTARELLKADNIDITYTINGVDKTLSMKATKNMHYGIASALIVEALGGNVQAVRELIDRTEGKAKETIQQDTTLEVTWKPLSTIPPIEDSINCTQAEPDSE